VRFLGRADHAGTTPLPQRLDAGSGASAFCLAARQGIMDEFPACVATVGKMSFEPGVLNVVPAVVTVSLEFRAPSEAGLDRIEARLREEAAAAAGRFGLGLEIECLDSIAPAPMDPRVQETVADACRDLGLDHTCLPSGAGHDAQSLAAVCPTGMVFVPSVGGCSHSAREFTEWEDCVNGANVLLQTALRLARA
jgi:N-carbamoyl-L-amino-acid hydrolase